MKFQRDLKCPCCGLGFKTWYGLWRHRNHDGCEFRDAIEKARKALGKKEESDGA